MDHEKIVEFVRAQGYSNVSAEGVKWRNYEVYEPKVSLMKAKLGLPQMVLVKEDKIRLSTPEEAYAFLDFRYPDEAER
ncbi:MAG: hypothetical protein J6M93_02265 [Succinivibrio sp.]|nr:hypothetical protein [Succinivibrio sp.]